ncbi:hypothetical protein K8T06_12090 [bacterium]|nr:hypothetical protein [bacterium]
MKKNVIYIFAISFLIFSANAAELPQQPSIYWSKVLSEKDFDDVLSVFQSGPKIQWPLVHSVKYNKYENQTQQQEEAEFHRLGDSLVYRLEEYEMKLQAVPSEEFCERSESLLSMRQHIAYHPSYYNLILVDSINRILYVNIAERLALAEQTTPCILTLVDQIGEYQLDLLQLRKMTGVELNKKIVDDSAYLSSSDANRLNLLWTSFGSEETINQLLPRNLEDMSTFQLIKKQNIPALISRLVRSDYFIHSILPIFIEYKEKAEKYDSTDNYQQIESVLGREHQTPESIGVVHFGLSRAASAVYYHLLDIQSGKLRKQLSFSLEKIIGDRSNRLKKSRH